MANFRDSTLGVLRWLDTVSLPGLLQKALEHQHLQRAMYALMDHQSAVDEVLCGL